MTELGSSIIDSIEAGGIVSIRDNLIAMQSKGRKVYRLEAGDPSFSTPPQIIEAINKALADGHTHYTAGAGIMPLREEIFLKLTRKNNIPLSSPEQVLVTNGAMHALYIAFRALCSPGDEILVPDPTWTETADNVTLAGGIPVRVPLDAETGYRYSANVIKRYITPRTRAIVINSPHNPTGSVCSREELVAIINLAAAHNLYILSDEAYEDILFDGRQHISTASISTNKVISVFSFSKSYAMSGLRLGYVATTDKLLLQRMSKLLRCTINGVNSATQYGGIAALAGHGFGGCGSMLDEYHVRRDALLDGLKDAKLVHSFKPEGAFFLWARIDGAWDGYEGKRDGWAMTKYLVDTIGVGSAPGEVFGRCGAGHVRFAFSCSTDQVLAASKLLAQVL